MEESQEQVIRKAAGCYAPMGSCDHCPDRSDSCSDDCEYFAVAYKAHDIMRRQLDEVIADRDRMCVALHKIDALERKCTDAWCGGKGDADLADLWEIGRIARQALSIERMEDL